MKLALPVLLALAMSAPVYADATAASRAFSEGQAAQLAGDYDRAAQSFELAFSIQPSKEALRSAVRARQLGGQQPRAATLAELLLAMYGDDDTSTKLAKEVIAEAKPKLARIAIKCAAPCTIAIGGRAASLVPATSHAIYLSPGSAAIQISFETGDAKRDVAVKAGEESRLDIPKPESTTPPPKPEEPPVTTPKPPSGVSPLVPVIGAGVTVVLAGVTTWSGVNTLNAHKAYVEDPTDEAYEAGRGKQLRTNILLGVTGVFALATAATAIFWTNWHGTQPTVNATSESATVGIAGRF